MHHISSAFGRLRALAPAAILLLALCLLATGVQAQTDPMNTAAAAPISQATGEPTLAGYETPLIVRNADQIEPAVYGSRIIWREMRNDYGGDIYSYDLVSHLELPEIASTSSYGKYTTGDFYPVISDAGIFAVWGGRSDADINNEIKGRTLAGEPINVTLIGEPASRQIQDLAIDGNWLVYVLNNGRLIKYDTTTQNYDTIQQTTNEIRSPDISGDSTVVWQEYDGNDWNIYWYNPQGQAVPLANDPGDQVSPTVDGKHVVWADNRSGNWDLYTADLSQPNPVGVPWLVAPGDQTDPQLSGDRVVWQDNRNGNWDIYLGSLASGAVTPVCTANGDQEAPAIDGDRILWQDKRNGNWDIYMFTLSTTAPVPVPTPAHLLITSPGTYSIAADGYDGNVTPIEIRSSDVILDGGGHVVDGSSRPGTCGIRIGGDAGPLSNIVVKNVRLTNWETGIRADTITSSVIEASEISHNPQGIVLDNTQDVQVRNNTITANDNTGIVVTNSGNTSVYGNDLQRTGDGFLHHFSSTMDLYTFAIVLNDSDGTVISHNDLGGDYGSLNLGPSNATRVTGNQLTGKISGIFSLSTVYGQSENTIVVDNVFRSWGSGLYGSLRNATWNTAPSPGPNIVGGPKIGGNFWGKLDGTGFSETHPDVNRDGFCDEQYMNGMGGVDQFPLAPWNGPAPGPTPYQPLSVPGRIQAEDYNLGGEGVAYHDTTPGNEGGVYRQDDVDIETTAGLSTPNVGWIRNGEWLTYTVDVTQNGTYSVTARVASPNSGRTVELSVDGQSPTTISVPNTGSFDAYRDATPPTMYADLPPQTPIPGPTGISFPTPVTLTAGRHVLKLTFSGDGQNLDWLELNPFVPPTPMPNGPAPYKPLVIPGTIQAEDYNLGGEGVAYHDTTPGNEGGAYRQDDVDIETANGVTNVGWIRNGEWLTYIVTVQSTGAYTMSAWMASPNSGRSMDLLVDGVQTARIMVPNTGSFSTFKMSSLLITLTAGTHTLKLTFSGDGQNLDRLEFMTGAVMTTTIPTGPPAGASFTATPLSAPKGTAVRFALSPAPGRTVRAAWWTFDSVNHDNTWNSRETNPTFFYPAAGSFSPLVKITYTDGSTETVEHANFIQAT
ncbi:carbohydrate-binding protein [Methanosphaerula subterraneus]|uniref:carbohydrate-binding protein n=1 Tax=Methanosphaerula subterraneus TaxID=3350244 RepID=UPI003F853C03